VNAVVTGGAGFIGSHVAAELIASGNEVLIVDDLSGGFLSNIPAGARFEQRSTGGPLDELFQAWKPELVYHLAAYAAEGLSHHIPAFNYENNLQGTVNVLSAAYRARARHFVFTSSIAAYGHSADGVPFTEGSPCAPCDPYGVAKLACENHIRAFEHYYGGPAYTIFRPHNVFGPGQNISDPYRNVIGIFLLRAMRNEPLPVFGDGSQSRSFSFITSVAKCIAQAPFVRAARNETFNVGGDEAMTVLELARSVCKATGRAENIQFLPSRKEVLHAHCSHDKVRSAFAGAFANETGIYAGLCLMRDHVALHEIPPATECPSKIEIADLLPPSWRDRATHPASLR
jgi:UDP-glucose 4-epimerase